MSSDGGDGSSEDERRRLDERFRRAFRTVIGDRNPLAVALVAIVAVALLMRLVTLGARVAHYDEGRVAYWGLHFAETGSFAYRFIIHGPVMQHATRWLFSLGGANDFMMRLPVALAGAALPASVWLFRKRLRRSELVATALLLALNPVLLYYSRFMRSDLLVATFMFVALGLLVRFADTRRPRYLYAAAIFVALGFGSKENAVVYVLTWIGAGALILEQTLYRPTEYESGFTLLATKLQATVERIRHAELRSIARFLAHAVGVPLAVVLSIIYIYAPRGDGMGGLQNPAEGGEVALWEAVGDPTKLWLLFETTAGHIGEGLDYWFGKAGAPDCSMTGVAGIDGAGLFGVDSITGYPCVLGQFFDVLVVAAAPLFALAVAGTLLERYGRTDSRLVVVFLAYAGFASLVGYPIGSDIFGAWLLIHVLVPLSIPAGVGLAAIYRRGKCASKNDDIVGTAVAGFVILLLVVNMLFVSSGLVYTNSAGAENDVLVQYAQPENALRGPIQDLDRIAADHGGQPDVVVYGTDITRQDGEEPSLDTKPYCLSWYNPMLPLPWYLYGSDATVECERDSDALRDRIENNPPPIVLTDGTDSTVPTDRLEAEYVARSGAIRQGGNRMRMFWIHEDWQTG